MADRPRTFLRLALVLVGIVVLLLLLLLLTDGGGLFSYDTF